ncbi:hypothetical protein ACFQE8_23160 [Salinirubellus sp. GCM10025818]|uniref:hypothetical protein n=1 Tax=Salinirubellus TaxID=2162630 RepID=UPI0030D4E8F2
MISILPRASSGELWTTNEFVATDGTVDAEAIKAVHGLDAERFEAETGQSLDAAAREARGEPIVPVEDHQDIVDERRKALHALGYDVKFRWQIASDRYSIINPQEAYLPIVDALEHRGETEAFGWASYRDWGGLLKLFVVCPGLEQTVTGGEASDPETDTKGLTAVSEMDGTDIVVYGGFETGYDFRGTQTLWAKPILYFPETGAVVPDTGKRYTRRHYGRATDAAHERANDRVPITEWWQSIYDDIDLRMVEVDRTIRRARAIAYDFETLPFSTTDCYRYWGIAETYALLAADRATTLAEPASRPTVYNLQLSLLLALLDEYGGSWASNTHQEYLEVAGELLRTPAMMIQLAVKEHDCQTDEPTERVLDEDQQTLSDALEDIVDIPGIDVDTEAALSDEQAQRLHDQVQRQLNDG